MGSGRWDSAAYFTAKTERVATGAATFAYTEKTQAQPTEQWKAHPLLDPYGVAVRESRDSAEHPESRAVMVLFDVTGSMRGVPPVLQEKLEKLMTMLVKVGIAHPHVLTGAVGDATCDKVPFQFGQFESDIRVDEQLRNVFLEGGGGAGLRESYLLALYAAAYKTDIDCWSKRGQKGYLFLVGDEMPYDTLPAREIESVFGGKVPQGLTAPELVASVLERYEAFFIIPSGAQHGKERAIYDVWQKLMGQRVLRLDDPALVCELIVSAVALTEGAADPEAVVRDLGLDEAGTATVGGALRRMRRGEGEPE